MTQNKGLTPQREAFALAVAGGMTQADAYRKAYPASKKWKDDSVHNKASALMRDAQVAARVAALKAAVAQETTMERVVIIREIARLATSDPRRIMDEKGRVRLLNEMDEDTARSIASCKIDEYGRIEYKFWDKNSALDKAAKMLGLYELDNKQKTDPLTALMGRLSGNVVGVVAEPVGDGDEG